MMTKLQTKKYIDSIFDEFEETNDSYLKAISHFNENKQNYQPYQYLFDYEIGKIYFNFFDDLYNAQLFFSDALNNIISDDYEIKCEINICLGNLNRDLFNYTKSRKYYNKCLNICIDKNDNQFSEYKEVCYRHIGQIHESLKEYDDAIEYYLKAHSFSKDTKKSGIALHLLGSLYNYELGEPTKAVEYALKADKILKNQKHYTIENYRILGQAYSMLDEFERAEGFYKKVLNVNPGKEYKYYIYQEFGQLYCHWHKEEDAIPYFQKALQCIDKNRISHNEDYLETKLWLAVANEGLCNYKESLKISSEILNENNYNTHNLIRILKINGRVFQKTGDFITGYYTLVLGIKDYEKSKYFDESNEDYLDVLKIKESLYKKLPIGNRLIERIKKYCN